MLISHYGNHTMFQWDCREKKLDFIVYLYVLQEDYTIVDGQIIDYKLLLLL